MNILYKLNVETPKDMYDLTKSPVIKKLSSIKGECRSIACAIIYEDINQDGETQKIFSFRCMNTGEIFATNSPTFIRDFEEIRDMLVEFNEEVHSILIEARTSRAGRTYLSCVYND